MLSSFSAAPTAAVTTVYLVRHAEKDLTPGLTDPELSAAGKARALLLPKAVGGKVAALFTTNTIRTRTTLAPLAAATGLEPQVYEARDPAALVARIRQEYAGKKCVVVGHSNTLLPLLAAFGASTSVGEIKDDEFSYLFKVSLPASGPATVEVLHYGAK